MNIHCINECLKDEQVLSSELGSGPRLSPQQQLQLGGSPSAPAHRNMEAHSQSVEGNGIYSQILGVALTLKIDQGKH